MPTYTYDDFLKATEKQGWGLGNGFSEADWKLAQENPDADRQEAMQKALTGAQYGDYRGLKAQGYNVDNIPYEYQKRYAENADNWNRQYQLAVLMAERGDPSYLDRLVKGLFP